MKRLLALSLLLVSLCAYCNRGSTVGLSGATLDSRYHWGREYIFAKDLLPLGFEAVYDGETLSLAYGSGMPGPSQNQGFPAIGRNQEITLDLNGLPVSHKILHGDIAICIDDFCDPEKIPPGCHRYPDAYYTAFQPLGYSAYHFKRGPGRSISFLPLEDSVVCNMGSTAFVKIDLDAGKSILADYCDLETVLREMGAQYTFEGNALDISGAGFQEVSIPLPSYVTNYTSLGYPVLSAEIFSPRPQSIPAYIVNGRLKVDTERFCDAYGYLYSKEIGEDMQERAVIKNAPQNDP